MKTLIRWLAIPTTLAIALGTIDSVLSQTIAISPTSQTIQLSGTSGGDKKDKSCAGYIGSAPNHVIQVTEDSNLTFTLKASGGQPALLIRSAAGKDFCVPADSYSGGKVDIPGRWGKGNYSIFIGDRANGKHPYTLSISPN
jgi:hypothetical protein